MKKIIISVTLLIHFCNAHNNIIYLIPFAGYHGDKIFEMNDPVYNRDDLNRPFFTLRECLRSLDYNLKTTTLNEDLKDFHALIACDVLSAEQLKKLSLYPKDKLVLLILEPPTVVPTYYETSYQDHFGKILIMLDDYVDTKKYIKLHFPQPSLTIIDHVPTFTQKKFCVLISANKHSSHPFELYSERRKIINFFEQRAPEDFDLFGYRWEKTEHPSYQGSVTFKKEILKNYKFCICYENMHDVNGYVTEKIFDAFVAGCVPVYWGAQNITDFVPAECFIDRRNFKTDEELYLHLKSVDEEMYKNYINNIKKFLVGSQAHYFSQEYFINQIIRELINQSSELSGS